MRTVGRNVVRIRLSSLLCKTIYNNKQELLVFKAILSVTDLHSNQATGLSPELCLPDVVLSQVKGPLILEHIWHQGHKILGKRIVKLIPHRCNGHSG